jgi:integrase
LVLTAAFCGLRFGELAALTRERRDLLHGTVTVAVSLKGTTTSDSVWTGAGAR